MGNKWIEALKLYNKDNKNWCVVKKGTAEYDKVKKMMDNMDTNNKNITKKKNNKPDNKPVIK